VSAIYQVITEDRQTYIYTRISGTGHDVDQFADLAKPAIDMCLLTSHKKLLLEDAIEDDWPRDMMEKLVSKLYRSGFDQLRISVYVANPARQFNTYFAETVGQNMGMNVQVSIDWEVAVNRLVTNKSS